MECPVDFIPINENKARLTAFFVLVLMLTYLATSFWLIVAFLFTDFLLRTFNLGKYCLLGFLSDAVIKQLKIKNKPVDRAPKRFAAGVGAIFTAAILITSYLSVPNATYILAVIMVLFAALEAFFSICAGCHVYSIGKFIFK